MNEGIDIAILGAKVAAKENTSASIAVHGVSAAYNISQLFVIVKPISIDNDS